MLGRERESNRGPEVQWVFHEKPLWSVGPELLTRTGLCCSLAAHQWATDSNLWCYRNYTKSACLSVCLSLDVYVVRSRWMLHEQFRTFEAYMIYHKLEMVHLHRCLASTDFLLLEGTMICTSRFLSPFLNIRPKGLWGYGTGMKTLHISWKYCVNS